MKSKSLVFAGLVVAILLVCAVAPVSAAEPSTLKLVNASYPAIMGPGEESTLYVTLTNTGTETVALNDIYLKYYGDDGGLVSTSTDGRNLPTRILAGETIKNIPVPIKAGQNTGTFYATICIDSNYGYVFDSKYPIVIKVMENTPELKISNYQITETGPYYTLKADINNLGFATASSLIVSTLEGGDVGPYSTYPIGNLDEDDLAGFTITFKMPENGILTLVTDYKDVNRNHVSESFPINVSNHLVKEEANPMPMVITIVIVALIVLLIIVAVVRKNKKGKRN